MALSSAIQKELGPYANMSVVPGITVGSLVFSSYQSTYSTAAFAAGGVGAGAGGGVANDANVDLFQYGIGDQVAGFAAGSIATRSHTNVTFANGTLPANECAVYTHCAFDVRVIDRVDLNNAQTFSSVNASAALKALGLCSWELTEANGRTQNMGPVGGYPAAPGWGASSTVAAAGADVVRGGQLGSSGGGMRRLPVPIIFRPSMQTRLTIRNGTAWSTNVLATGATWVGAAPATVLWRCSLKGFLFTMPA